MRAISVGDWRNDCKWGSENLGEFKVVEAYNRNVLRNSQLMKMKRLNQVHRGDSL